MPNPKRPPADLALAPALVYATASTCGVLAALALQIQLSRAGFDLLGLWQNLSSSRAMQLRSAGPWWAIAAVAFVVGGVIAASAECCCRGGAFACCDGWVAPWPYTYSQTSASTPQTLRTRSPKQMFSPV
jgi:hypothetical protein